MKLRCLSITILGLALVALPGTGLAASTASDQNPATTTKNYPKAREQANELSEAMLSGDYERAADLTFPRLVALIGGRAKYVAVLQKQLRETQSANFRIVSNVAGDPVDIIEVGSVIYAIIPTTMRIKVPEGILVGQYFLIGISNDHGEHWTFVDTGAGRAREQLKILFPNAADKLNLPETRPPVLQRVP